MNVEKNFGKTVSPKLGKSVSNFINSNAPFKCPSLLTKKRLNPCTPNNLGVVNEAVSPPKCSDTKKFSDVFLLNSVKEKMNDTNISDKSDDSKKISVNKKAKFDDDDDFLNISSRMESICISNSNLKLRDDHVNKYRSKYGGITTKLFTNRKPLMKPQQQTPMSDFDYILKKTREENNLIKKMQRVNKLF